MPLKDYYKDIESRMHKGLEVFQQELVKVRTGTASTSLVDHILVEAYGSMMPINQLATLGLPEARTIVIQPWDVSIVSAIEKAIMKSDLGLVPNNDGKVIRIIIPALSEERRNDLIKVVKKISEEARVAIRNIRRDANDHLKAKLKNKEISEDDESEGIEQIQKMTDRFIEKINDLLKHKEADLLKI